MGTHSYSDNCPKCDELDTLSCCTETGRNFISGECLNCGYVYYTEEKQMTLQELNEIRSIYDLTPLSELKIIEI